MARDSLVREAVCKTAVGRFDSGPCLSGAHAVDGRGRLSEAYEESAVFEYLRPLRADLSSFSDPAPYWTVPNELAEEMSQEITQEIFETEILANEITARRVRKFRDQYEWARSGLPEPKKSNLQYRINFADLEQVTGMDFLRRNYLMRNERIHAGAYSVINHFDFGDPKIISHPSAA
jgi:hypothetical protein